MSKKSNCWLCDRGTGLDNGGLAPGELEQDFFGDMVCIYCEHRINFLSYLLAHSEVIPLVSDMEKLPKVDGYSVGFNRDAEVE